MNNFYTVPKHNIYKFVTYLGWDLSA
jgi:hypothetical protein